MKKILTIIFILIPFHSLSIEKTTTFTLEKFNQAQEDGKTVVINSWNKSCFTCAKQIKIQIRSRVVYTMVHTHKATQNESNLLFLVTFFAIMTLSEQIKVSQSSPSMWLSVLEKI